ncbi:helix-turn-helix domain-containing protein [Streptomyces sulphureus]|uniref:helix-turn-helix domain-containing protein n=1 Tax=Streptomyces sulphureus TaxID=47758 RepID=UPI00036AD742|nr:helix-turn-helix transcriptional regulator [Streptomyces sulphureus]
MPQAPKQLDDTASWEAWFGVELRNWRRSRGFSTERLGISVHVSKTTVERIEKAERSCNSRLANAFDDALDAGGALRRLWRRVEQYLDASLDADRSLTPIAAEGRSALLTPVDSGTPASGLVMGFDDPLQVVAEAKSVTGSNAEPSLLAHADASLRGIVARYEALGPRPLVHEARLLRSMLHVILAGTQPPSVRARLLSSAARTAGLLGYMAVNAGAPLAVTDAYCTEADTLARQADDIETVMWTLGTRSFGLYYAGRYRQAAAVARSGVELAPCHPQAIRLLANGEARALARAGDRRGAERALGGALDLSDSLRELPKGMTACIDFLPYSPARTLANAVTVHLSLGDADRVLKHAGEINTLVEGSDSAWSRTLVRLDIATALLQRPRPELDRAMTLGAEALHCSSDRPITSVRKRASELLETAAPWRDQPRVVEYRRFLHSWLHQHRPIPGT